MKARAIAFYLPQYHPVAANDAFWGKGFTEWTNVTKAKPLFRGHQQPFLPSDLGFYDLRVPEVREQQASLARDSGIEGFCYWHYWFGHGKRVLERVFEEVLRSGKPDFPFCLGWANESWTGKWHGLDNEMIFEQCYPGEEDYIAHFHHLLPAFQDRRYIRVNGKPIFVIYRPDSLPDCAEFCRLWTELAQQNGLPGLHFISNGFQSADWCMINGMNGWAYNKLSVIIDEIGIAQPMHFSSRMAKVKRRLLRLALQSQDHPPDQPPASLRIATYSDYTSYSIKQAIDWNEYPVVYPNWDSSPRLKNRAYILLNSSAAEFENLMEATVEKLQCRPVEERIMFIKSWNEWAEGNTIEPSVIHGQSYLQSCARVLL